MGDQTEHDEQRPMVTLRDGKTIVSQAYCEEVFSQLKTIWSIRICLGQDVCRELLQAARDQFYGISVSALQIAVRHGLMNMKAEFVQAEAPAIILNALQEAEGLPFALLHPVTGELHSGM